MLCIYRPLRDLVYLGYFLSANIQSLRDCPVRDKILVEKKI